MALPIFWSPALNFDPSRRETGGVTDPWEYWDAAAICRATSCPVANIQANWPLVHAIMHQLGIASRNSQGAMIATIAIETASSFLPRRELYNDPPGEYAYFEGMYGIGHHRDAPQLQNCPGSPAAVGDGAKYYGRGFIQITWKANYYKHGKRLGIDLVANPERARETAIAADIAPHFWEEKGIAAMADARDWAAVRAAVQGGSLGLDRLIQVVTTLGC